MVATGQAQLAAQPPPGMKNFPLQVVDTIGDSFVTCGFTSANFQLAFYNRERLKSFENIAKLPLHQVDNLAEALAGGP